MIKVMVDKNDGCTLFLDLPGETGKTFLINLLLARYIVLATAIDSIGD